LRKLATNIVFIIFISLALISCGRSPVNIYAPPKPPPAKPLENINIALVLGGGGSRGVAHAGVISVLEENNIPIDLIVGTSIGSAVGAIYADQVDSKGLRKMVLKLNKYDVLDPNIHSGMKMLWGVSGFIDGHALRGYLQKTLRSRDFSQLKIPLAVVTVDVNNGELFVIRSGPIIPAVHASSAVPLVFTPVRLYRRTLVDGGIISPVPLDVARQLGAKKIIAVDIGNVVKPTKVRGSYELADRCLWLSYKALTKWETQSADVLIQPEFETTSMFDDSKLSEYYYAGRIAAEAALPKIKALLKS